jgi:hypothetical protein
MTRRKTIGFDRRLALDWLEATASRVAAGDSLEDLRAGMWEYLEGKVSGDKLNSDRGTTMTVLTRIWGKVPAAVEPLKPRAVAAFQISQARDHLALHWAMAIASYPVFSDVAATAGRLLTLQDSFSLAQLTKRMVAQWSERPVLVKSTQRIIRSLVDWGALTDTETKGVYARAPKSFPVTKEIAVLLCESLLLDNEHHSLPANQLLDHPAIFPFTHLLTIAELREEPVFDIHRQGIDGDMIELRYPQAPHVMPEG